MDTEPPLPANDAVAIIGMACRFPGGAHSPEQFFENLEAGRSAWCEFPADRLNIDGFYHPSSQRHDSFTFKGAHFLTGNIAAFDAEFFSMSAAESNSTDVQQRILLEVAYEAVENAGIPKQALAGSDASVYIGSFVKDYEQVSMRDTQYLAADCATGNGIAIMSNRISYFFDIHGPSMTIDTGCSASLICIHQAVQSLLNRESSMAMAGGAGMILTPSTIMPMVSLGFLSNDGKCYTFDSRANGYGRGEGVGIVVLKRLSDAIRDNDTIRGVIRGTSTNQDGRTSGITLPSSEAQVRNIRRCYANAGLDFDKTMFVECHGTGTQAGDPRELKAISDALCEQRDSETPMLVGSAKTNIGHLEGSAGVAGVIKAVMTIEKGRIPKHINFESWNPDIDHKTLKVDIAHDNKPWPTMGLRRISVNSFGFGGSNAHAIIDDAAHFLEERRILANHNTWTEFDDVMDVSPDYTVKAEETPMPYLFVFSANDQAGVARIVDAYMPYLLARASDKTLMRDYAYTLFCRRSRLQYKAFVLARNHDELVSGLEKIKAAPPVRSQKSKAPNLTFIFCGQGAQWSKMGMDLCIFEPFYSSLKESRTIFHSFDPCFDLGAALEAAARDDGTAKINSPVFAQPATTAVQIALVDLLTASGVKPTAAVGHSSGEIAAAYAAGYVSKRGALTIAYYRGKAAARVLTRGGMLAVSLSKEDAQKYVEGVRQGSVCVACINSPESVTLSGDADQVKLLQEALAKDGITSKLLAFMVTMYLRKTATKVDGPAMFSSVTGERVYQNELNARYWVNNMVSPVEFQKAVSTLIKAEKGVRPDVFLEVSPHSVLRQALSEITHSIGSKGEIPYLPMMVRKKDGSLTVLTALGDLWTRAVPVQLDWLHQDRAQRAPKCLVDLPTYPWDHSKTYWHESHLSKAHRFRKFGSHDFLGAMTADSITPQEPRWRGFIDIIENPWIEHHKIEKKTMYPAAGMVIMAVEAAKQVVDGAVDSPADILDFEISDFRIEEPMIVHDGETRLEYNFNATRVEESTTDRVSSWRYSFTIYSILDTTTSAPPYQHTADARGFFTVRFYPRGLGVASKVTRLSGLEELPKDSRATTTPADLTKGAKPREFYERLNIIGLNYGRLFRNIIKMSPANEIPESESMKYCWTKVRVPNTRAVMPEEYETPSTIHPATLDSMFQSLFVLGDDPMVPYHIDSIRISADAPNTVGGEFTGYSEAQRKSKREATSDIVYWAGQNGQRPVVVIKGLSVITMANTGKAIPDFIPDHRNLCSKIVWKEDHQARGRWPQFEQTLERMGHRFPGLRVLQVGGEEEVVRFVMEQLASDTTTRLTNYTIMSETDETFQAAKDATSKELRSLLAYQTLEDKFDVVKSLGQQKFDIILADVRLGIGREVLYQVLKSTGILASTYPSATGLVAPVDWKPLEIHSLPQSYPAKMSTESVVILTREDVLATATSRANTLAARLQAKAIGLTVVALIPTQFKPVLEQAEKAGTGCNTYIISLLDLDGDKDTVFDITAEDYAFIQRLFQQNNKGLLWVTAGAQMDTDYPSKSPFLGWARTVRSEEPDKQIVCLDLETRNHSHVPRKGGDYASPEVVEEYVAAICDVFFRSFASTVPLQDRETELAHRQAKMMVPRLEPLEEINRLIEGGFEEEEIHYRVPGNKDRPLKLVRGASGLFEDVYFKEDAELLRTEGTYQKYIFIPRCDIRQENPDFMRELLPHEVLIDVEEICLIPDGPESYQTDVWGKVAAVGKDVKQVGPGSSVVTVSCGPVANRVIVDQRFIWEDTTSLLYPPTCLVTASFCLRVVGKDARVLVHGSAGAYGQAAIQLAWLRGAQVYGVVADEDEKKALVHGGVLNEKHVLINDATLPERVAYLTARKGMDFIFNPTAHHRDVDLRMVRPYGQVIHLTYPGAIPSVAPSTGCFQLKTFDFVSLMKHRPERVAEHMDIVYGLSEQGIMDPIGRKDYAMGQVRTALKDLKDAPDTGLRVLTRGAEEDKLPFMRTLRDTYKAVDLGREDKDSYYIVVGGLGGLGLDVVKFLADHGAKHIFIWSRSVNHGEAVDEFLESIRQRGVAIKVQQVDICDFDSCLAAVNEWRWQGIVRGIIQCAAVVKDGIYQNITHADWQAATRVKTLGSDNIRKLTEEYMTQLHFLIFLSSAAGIIGNLGQANYNAGNSYQDALARRLSSTRGGSPHAVSIDLGPVLGAGMVADDEALWDQLRAGGFIGVRLEDFHVVLERAMAGRKARSDDWFCPSQVVMGVGTGGLVRQNKTTNPFWTRTPLFRFLNRVDLRPGQHLNSDDESGGGGGGTASLRAALKAASSRAEAAELLLPHFVRALGEVMGKNHAEIDPDSVLDDHGPDSLRMKEILDWVQAATGEKTNQITTNTNTNFDTDAASGFKEIDTDARMEDLSTLLQDAIDIDKPQQHQEPEPMDTDQPEQQHPEPEPITNPFIFHGPLRRDYNIRRNRRRRNHLRTDRTTTRPLALIIRPLADQRRANTDSDSRQNTTDNSNNATTTKDCGNINLDSHWDTTYKDNTTTTRTGLAL
ncbi:hypothetical protein GE09DRAFT_1236274 [Coniochaeta sp. 2T2.1]|nr:hypothetical protein GE09DRAFT_1236274 [Coniochaeta sp. 2T2.1]